ncbi:MAG: DUF3365 domain-containing protein [Deltaproteobacteria bacterium]|nr:DUF3365 domain-containing protein [Deltaproteobacteria bacterium]
MKISIRLKFGLILLVFVAIMAGTKLATSYVNSLQKDYALYINLAGRQRMLSQKMTGEAVAIAKEMETIDKYRVMASHLEVTKNVLSVTLGSNFNFKRYKSGFDGEGATLIRQISTRPRNPKNTPDEFERRALEVFADNDAQEEYYSKSITESGIRQIRYIKRLNADKVCLDCHGRASNVPEIIKKRYPNDEATGYSEGELMGALSITAPIYGSIADTRILLASTRDLFNKTLKALALGGETTDTKNSPITLMYDPNLLLVDEFNKAINFWTEFDKNISVILNPKVTVGSEDFRNAMTFIETNSSTLLAKMNTITSLYQELSENAIYLFEWVQLITLTIILLSSFLVFLFFSRFIVRPLEATRDSLHSIALGDLSGNNITVKSNDELGDVVSSLNLMTTNLREVTGEVRVTSKEFNSISSEINTTVDELSLNSSEQISAVKKTSSAMIHMDSSITEIAKNTDNLSKTAEDTSSAVLEIAASIDEVAKISEELSLTVEEVSSSISEMAFSVKEITGHTSNLSAYASDTASAISEIDASIREVEINIKNSARLSEATATNAGDGREAVLKTSEAMENINITVEEVASVIKRFVEKAISVGEILKVINEMAEQTNLLSLNAAIIAAQAGEHGKGFAVVSDEIKDFSDRTASSIKQIEKLIRSVQLEATNAVKSVEAVGKSVETGVTLSNNAANSLEKILSSANSSSQMVEHIAKANSEQLKGSRQVTEAMEKITDMLSKVYRAIEDQEKGSSYIAKAAEQMMDAASQVRKATKEQSRGGELIARGVENISVMTNTINKSTQEQARGSRVIVRTVNNVQTSTEKNVANIKKIRSATQELLAKTSDLTTSIKKFRGQ